MVVVTTAWSGCGGDERPLVEVDPSHGTTLDLASSGIAKIAASPDRGFHHAYYLLWPAGFAAASEPTADHLLVIPNNTGTADDDLAVHEERARRALRRYGAAFATTLPSALLMPLFPRPLERWQVYTHALDRDVMLLPADDPLARLDLQLIAMIDHARQLLAASGRDLAPAAMLFGFSASGTFVNRFTALHPERVCAVAAGGVNGLPILPLAELDGMALPFPIGIADLDTLTGRPFAAAAWRDVPQLVFMGADDENDTLPYGDAWNDDERSLIGQVLGEQMMPARWERVQELLAGAPGLTLRTYPDRGHEVAEEMVADVQALFRAAAADARPLPGVDRREVRRASPAVR